MCPTVSTVGSAAYMRRRTGLAFLQVMACPLFGTESFPEQRLTYSQLDYSEQMSMKFESKYKRFLSWKCIWKYRLRNGGHFVEGEMSGAIHKSPSNAYRPPLCCIWILENLMHWNNSYNGNLIRNPPAAKLLPNNILYGGPVQQLNSAMKIQSSCRMVSNHRS